MRYSEGVGRGHLKETEMKTTKRTWVSEMLAALRQAVVNLLYG
jgi:hypothetical protein